MNRRKLAYLFVAFALTASVAFLLGLYAARGNVRDPDSSADSGPKLAHVSAPPKLLLDTSKVDLLPDAGLHLAPMVPPSAPSSR